MGTYWSKYYRCQMHGRAYLMPWCALRNWHVTWALRQTIGLRDICRTLSYTLRSFKEHFALGKRPDDLDRPVQYSASEARFRLKAILIILYLRWSIMDIKIDDSLRHRQQTNKQINIYFKVTTDMHMKIEARRVHSSYEMRFLCNYFRNMYCAHWYHSLNHIINNMCDHLLWRVRYVFLRLGWQTARQTGPCDWLFVLIDQKYVQLVH